MHSITRSCGNDGSNVRSIGDLRSLAGSVYLGRRALAVKPRALAFSVR